jgi:hypothetical protein
VRRLIAALLTVLALPAAALGDAAPADAAALEGRWVLDAEASDGGRRRLEREVRDVAGDLRPRRPGNPALPSQRVRAPRLGDQLLAVVHLPERRVDLAVEPDRVRFRRDGGSEEVLPTDGRPTVVDAANPGVRMAAWEAGELWIERASDHGTRVIERWYAQAPGLAVDYQVRNALFEDPVEFTLRFRPAEDVPAP